VDVIMLKFATNVWCFIFSGPRIFLYIYISILSLWCDVQARLTASHTVYLCHTSADFQYLS